LLRGLQLVEQMLYESPGRLQHAVSACFLATVEELCEAVQNPRFSGNSNCGASRFHFGTSLYAKPTEASPKMGHIDLPLFLSWLLYAGKCNIQSC